MSTVALINIVRHWDARRMQAEARAGLDAVLGRPTLAHLRESSRCEARINKLVRLVERASVKRGAA